MTYASSTRRMATVPSHGAGRPPLLGRILASPLTRLVAALVLFYAFWRLGDLVISTVVGRPPGGLVGRASIAAASLGALLLVGGVLERRRPAEIGFPRRNALRDLGLGLLLGAALLSAVVGVMAVAGWYRVEGFLWNQESGRGGAVYAAAMMLLYYGMVAVTEEALFRGIGFRLIEEALGTWIALALSALLFGLSHLGNQHATLWSAVAVALESGVLFGAAYVLVRNLWLPIGLHWTWNYFEGPIYGTPVSGAQQSGLLRPAITGPELWTGGAFGPEAGLVMVILCGGLGVLALFLCVRQERPLAPAWLRRGAGAGHGGGHGGPRPASLPARRTAAATAAAGVAADGSVTTAWLQARRERESAHGS